MRVLKLILLTGLQALTWSQAYARASIEVPAGVLPSSDSPAHLEAEVPLERSKSRVLPLTGYRSMASRNLDTNKKNAKLLEKMGRLEAAPDGGHKLKLAQVQPAAQKPVVQADQPVSASPSSKIPDFEMLKKSGSSDAKPPESNSENPLDSAAASLDLEEAMVGDKSGFRLEDIVGPRSHYIYSSTKRHNPFVPTIVPRNQQRVLELGSNDVEIPILNPLQYFSLSQLLVIGVWESESKGWKAIVQTPKNQGIEVGLGDPAGNSGGRVMAISDESVVVREFKVRTDGGREYQDVQLSIGGNAPANADDVVGGRLIMRPGASNAEIEYFGGTKRKSPPGEVTTDGKTQNALKEEVSPNNIDGAVKYEEPNLKNVNGSLGGLPKSNIGSAP